MVSSIGELLWDFAEMHFVPAQTIKDADLEPAFSSLRCLTSVKGERLWDDFLRIGQLLAFRKKDGTAHI
ncbi:MAG: hypothetical protein ACRYHA_33140 [Janthinobacterium lividum]